MKYLHIMTNDKFNTGYIKFIEENFDMSEHLFVFWSGSSEDEIKILERENIFKIKNFIHKIVLTKYLYESEKIFLHGLHNKRLNKLLFFNPSCLKKCNWIIWGGDLHEYEWERKFFKERKKEFYRKFIIKRFGAVTTYLKEEWKLVEQWYGFKGEKYDCIAYPSNLYQDDGLVKNDNEKIVIQIGNSAVPRNNHIEILEKLKKYQNENIEIIVPLSYGSEDYANEVIKKGKELFGEKFIPMTELIPYKEYLEFLSKIDIAIFNHKKHQAMGNILKLLGMGKKVYLNEEDFITGRLTKDLSLKIFGINKGINLEKITKIDIEKNKKIIKSEFSEEKLKKEWSKIFID